MEAAAIGFGSREADAFGLGWTRMSGQVGTGLDVMGQEGAEEGRGGHIAPAGPTAKIQRPGVGTRKEETRRSGVRGLPGAEIHDKFGICRNGWNYLKGSKTLSDRYERRTDSFARLMPRGLIKAQTAS
jgi:hypothetical protein